MIDKISLRTRLLLAVFLTTLIALSLADVVVYVSIRHHLYGQVDNMLEASHRSVEATADDPSAALDSGSLFVPGGSPGTAAPPDGDDDGGGDDHDGPATGSSVFCAIGRESAPGMFIEVRGSSGVITGAAGREYCPANQPGDVAYSPALPSTVSGFAPDPNDPNELVVYLSVPSSTNGGPAFRVRASKLDDGDVLYVATSLSPTSNTLAQLLVDEVFVTLGTLLAAVALGTWLVRVGLRPLRDVERTAEMIAGGDLVHRAPNATDRTEVGRLAGAFNVMLERIEGLFNDLRSSESRLRRFVGDASHELRTPIAAVSAYTQLFSEGAADRPEDLARVMDGIGRESARMAKLVEDLLLLAKFDEHRPLDTEPVELVELILEAVETAVLVGAAWPVNFRADDAVEVLGNRIALRQVLDNLLANVRAHTPPGTRTTLSLRRDGAEAVIEVADDGPGITAEQATMIFERFFRADPSRTRSTGGAGLGLAIVASIVSAHGGRVTAAPGDDGGSRFTIVLPAIEDPDRSE